MPTCGQGEPGTEQCIWHAAAELTSSDNNKRGKMQYNFTTRCQQCAMLQSAITEILITSQLFRVSVLYFNSPKHWTGPWIT